jgi:glycosyltransferase involved in cell wall biosynthesis
MEITDLVSICIATYNRSHLLTAAIENVLQQTYPDFELLIVNDGSEDNTESIVRHYQKKDNRIYYFKHATNKGLAAARNTAICNSRGRFFTFIDDDDTWHRDFLLHFVKTASNYDDNWCFCCGTDYINNLGNHIRYVPKMNGPLKEYIKKGYTPPVAAQFYNLSTVKKAGGYTEEVRSGVDHDLWLKLAFHDINICGVPKALVHPNTCAEVSRITFSDMRWLEIQRSLVIWKTDIVIHFGVRFFYHFRRCYYFGRQRRQFIVFLKQKTINQAIVTRLFLAFCRMPFKIEFFKESLFKLLMWFCYRNRKYITLKTPHSFPPFR